MSSKTNMYLGVDVAKDTLAVCLMDAHKTVQLRATYANTPPGFRQLWRALGGMDPAALHIGMEATGIYWEALAQWAHAQRAVVFVLNPARVKAFSRAEGQRQKTDPVDAGVIARFILAQALHPWTPPAPALRELTALVRRLDGISAMLRVEKNRAATATLPVVRASLRRTSAALKKEYAVLAHAGERILAATPALAHDLALLMTIPGVSRITARRLLVFLRRTPYETARQAGAASGLTPTHCLSGTSIHKKPHISRLGDAALRQALFSPAVCARRYNPRMVPWAQALTQRGKCNKVVICAIARKLVHCAFGVLKHQTPFQPPQAA